LATLAIKTDDKGFIKTVMATPEQVDAGQSVYTKRTLAVYDFIVLGASNHLIWRCPTQRLVDHYNQQVTANHLDVGIGTGYFLDRCRFPSPTVRIALMDLNFNALGFAAERIARYHPEIYRQNVLEPISLDAEKFDSVGINYLLHCLPGSVEVKSIVFDHLKTLMNPNAIIFGSTLLQGGVQQNWAAKRLMKVYNQRKIFSNRHDDLEGLKRSLSKRFRDVSIQVVGCAALFSGQV
jgi:2-polyprenyl-3-methyl-5-hydroxy-6-metoxy-1,4-benzoquinol methylase